ncbi:Glutaminase liver isoform, mitochondrial [Anabarilius grahami]|uniref:Glutaminase liver isoform, mitochondrial n=1 Tax=Anabarilius grahami TaxID=495550 RepID=A0A3N0YDU3_ANAGA|nr:Glutaminase liver isoform, mitochondrial [Anabarilius grahami]
MTDAFTNRNADPVKFTAKETKSAGNIPHHVPRNTFPSQRPVNYVSPGSTGVPSFISNGGTKRTVPEQDKLQASQAWQHLGRPETHQGHFKKKVCVTGFVSFILKALQGRFVIPDFSTFTEETQKLFIKCKQLSSVKLATRPVTEEEEKYESVLNIIRRLCNKEHANLNCTRYFYETLIPPSAIVYLLVLISTVSIAIAVIKTCEKTSSVSTHSHFTYKRRKYLLSGADVNAVDYDGRSALHVAASEGRLDVIKFLVENAGANCTLKDRWGNTALQEAMRCNQDPAIQCLKKYTDYEESL